MTDVTESVATVYGSLRRVFEDMNKLGVDFGQGLREEGLDLTDSAEYSYSPNTLSLKRNHTWLYSRASALDAGSAVVLTFAACFVYFEADHGRWKAGPAGRPEVWFFIGTVSPPPTKMASVVQSFFDKGEVANYDVKPILGGHPSLYKYVGAETWNLVCLGYDLGEIDSVATLKAKVVEPLMAEATKDSIVA